MVVRMRDRTVTSDEGNKPPRIVRRSGGSVMTWRWARIVPLSARGRDGLKIAEVTFTSADRVRDVSHNINTGGLASPRPK